MAEALLQGLDPLRLFQHRKNKADAVRLRIVHTIQLKINFIVFLGFFPFEHINRILHRLDIHRQIGSYAVAAHQFMQQYRFAAIGKEAKLHAGFHISFG